MSTISPVYLASCPSYEPALLDNFLTDAFSALGVRDEEIRGRRVVIKPNLVLAKKPDFGVTSHPAFVSALVRLLHKMGASAITLADSPGGPYVAPSLLNTYRVCALSPLASEQLTLNTDCTWRDASFPGKRLKSFHCITPVYDADVVIDLCKLKTHSLTTLSCAVKNLFGIIPGVEKFELHASYPKIPDFSEMLVDLADFVTREKTCIAICDGIIAMEGNGPTHGIPKRAELALVSRSPFSLDVIAEHIIAADGEVLHLDAAADRGLMPRNWRDIPVLGMDDIPVIPFARPDTEAGKLLRNLPNYFGGRLAKFFETKPKILTANCVGCGKCVESCPRHTISITEHRGKKIAKIDYSQCIRCYCCQELCPIGAVGTRQNPLIKLIH